MLVLNALMQAVQDNGPTTADLGPMIAEVLDNVNDLSLLPEDYRQQAIAHRIRPKLPEGDTAPVQRARRRP